MKYKELTINLSLGACDVHASYRAARELGPGFGYTRYPENLSFSVYLPNAEAALFTEKNAPQNIYDQIHDHIVEKMQEAE